MPRFSATFRSSSERFSVAFRDAEERFGAEFTNIQPFVNVPTYDGETTVTPSGEVQVLPTAGLRLVGNVTVTPIPNNYGLITWDGSILTIS